MKFPKLPIAAQPKSKSARSVPLWLVSNSDLSDVKSKLPEGAKKWALANGFSGKSGTYCSVPTAEGEIAGVLVGYENDCNPLVFGGLATKLPKGNYHFEQIPQNQQLASLGFMLGSYQFNRYIKAGPSGGKLALSKEVDEKTLVNEANATFMVRDLINTPTNDMGPDQLEAAAAVLANHFKAKISVIKGNELLKKNFPMIHAVGRASVDAPRLIDIKWGKASDPKVTLVGKGVCFDTGGLNIKPGSSMGLMKKDMGGAANVLGLAYLIMAAKLPVQLRVLIPAVENSISGNAFRPGDILSSRKGISVEIGNTDAEGRLVLGDALAYGDEENPDLMIDMATLTGAARVALGPDLPPFYTDKEDIAARLAYHAGNLHDPLWRMPLWKPYIPMLSSQIADTNHITSGGFAGSVTAALFLQKFVLPKTNWIHLDVFGWVPSAKPWAPVGGEAQGIRALFALIKERYKA